MSHQSTAKTCTSRPPFFEAAFGDTARKRKTGPQAGAKAVCCKSPETANYLNCQGDKQKSQDLKSTEHKVKRVKRPNGSNAP